MRSLVLIADDIAAAGRIRAALHHSASLRIGATLDARQPAGGELARLQPDIVLVAESCQRTNTVRRLAEAAEHTPGAALLLLAARDRATTGEDAVRLGVDAVVSPEADGPALGVLLGQIAQGHVLLAPRRQAGTSGDLRFPAARPGLPHLRLIADQDARGTRAKA